MPILQLSSNKLIPIKREKNTNREGPVTALHSSFTVFDRLHKKTSLDSYIIDKVIGIYASLYMY